MDSRECNRIIDNIMKLMRESYFEGYHQGRLDEQRPLLLGNEWLVLEYRDFLNSHRLSDDFAEWRKTQPMRS
jgi:hypothetical protein